MHFHFFEPKMVTSNAIATKQGYHIHTLNGKKTGASKDGNNHTHFQIPHDSDYLANKSLQIKTGRGQTSSLPLNQEDVSAEQIDRDTFAVDIGGLGGSQLGKGTTSQYVAQMDERALLKFLKTTGVMSDIEIDIVKKFGNSVLDYMKDR